MYDELRGRHSYPVGLLCVRTTKLTLASTVRWVWNTSNVYRIFVRNHLKEKVLGSYYQEVAETDPVSLDSAARESVQNSMVDAV
jgi:hypothetical protein